MSNVELEAISNQRFSWLIADRRMLITI